MGTYPRGWGTRRGETGQAAARGYARAQKTAWQRLVAQGIVPSDQPQTYVRWLDPHLTAGQTISQRDLAGIERKAAMQRPVGCKTVPGMGMITTGMGKPGRGRMPFTAQRLMPAGSGTSIGAVVGVGTLAYIAWRVLL